MSSWGRPASAIRRLLGALGHERRPRAFDPSKFEPTGSSAGHAVLLIDDTWTTGASAESAAAALRRAGAGPIAAVVIGRYLNREWPENPGA